MRGMWEFQERYGTEAGCIEALAQLRWPQGYVCARCGERRSYQLKTRARTVNAEVNFPRMGEVIFPSFLVFR